MVKINGKCIDADGLVLSDYLADCGFDVLKIAVEKNGSIVPKAQYADTILCDGDCIEVVSFVGGG